MTDKKGDAKKPATRKPAGGVFDVSRPGKTPAHPTSRPVIIGHKSSAAAAQAAVSGIGEASPASARRKIQITPTGDLRVETVQTRKVQISEPDSATETQQVKDADGTPVSQRDQEALATAALDAVTGPPDLSEVEESKLAEVSGLAAQPDKLEPAATESEPQDVAPVTEVQDMSTVDGVPEVSESQAAVVEKDETTSEEETVPKEAGPQEEQSPVLPGTEAEDQDEDVDQPKPEPHIEPLFDDSGAITSRRKQEKRKSGVQTFLMFVLIVILAAVAVNIALDLELFTAPNIPHTDFL